MQNKCSAKFTEIMHLSKYSWHVFWLLQHIMISSQMVVLSLFTDSRIRAFAWVFLPRWFMRVPWKPDIARDSQMVPSSATDGKRRGNFWLYAHVLNVFM